MRRLPLLPTLVVAAAVLPVAIALARQARRMGLEPGFLSRGPGGSLDLLLAGTAARVSHCACACEAASKHATALA